MRFPFCNIIEIIQYMKKIYIESISIVQKCLGDFKLQSTCNVTQCDPEVQQSSLVSGSAAINKASYSLFIGKKGREAIEGLVTGLK